MCPSRGRAGAHWPDRGRTDTGDPGAVSGNWDRKIRDHAESRPFTRFDLGPLGRGKPLPYGGNGGVFIGGRHVALAL